MEVGEYAGRASAAYLLVTLLSSPSEEARGLDGRSWMRSHDGDLHLGGSCTALFNYSLRAPRGGTFVPRVLIWISGGGGCSRRLLSRRRVLLPLVLVAGISCCCGRLGGPSLRWAPSLFLRPSSRLRPSRNVGFRWCSCMDQHIARAALDISVFSEGCSPTTRWASVALGAGVGIGAAYTECSYIFNGSPPKWSSQVSTASSDDGPNAMVNCLFTMSW